jgi:branched-chain amino acid transport system ATP-binding protein
VVALLGPNGAGKTTTLLTISGLLRSLGGSLQIFGEPVGKRSASGIARSGVAHVPEDRSLFTQLTVAENVRPACRGTGRRSREGEVLGYFPELARIRSRKAGLLSGREQQMLAVARALASSPKLLLVDEMSLGLAPVVVRRLLPILRTIARTIARDGGIGVLFVEQHVQFALDLADRAYLMNRGRIALAGTGAELRTRKDLVQRHLRDALAARQHVSVSEEHYETAGRELLPVPQGRPARLND